MTAPVPQESTLLPPLARKLLQDAARVKNTADDPLARQRAIGIATKKVKQMYPLFFK
jgi:hypothetical protein